MPVRLPLTIPPTASVREPDIDALFAQDVEAHGPGAAVGLYHEGALKFAKGYGLADLESGRPITPQTPFHVASVSKQFTAFAVALLAREGKVDLDADIRDYLPYVPDFGTPIRVRHLILHTSGLRNQWPLLMYGGQSIQGRITQQQIVNLVARQQGLNFPPGSDHLYSNTGYTLLAELVFAVSGQTLREFTSEQIFTPLGMERTFFFDDVTEVVPHRANSYSKRREAEAGAGASGWARALLNFDNAGATSLFTTVQDLATWAGNLTNPVVGDRALIEQVSTGGTLDDQTPIHYGFGLIRDELNGRATLRHTGSDAAFRSVFVHFPDHDFAVSILANTELDLMSKVGSIADLYLPPAAANVKSPPAADTETDLSKFVGTYLPECGPSSRLEVRDGTLVHLGGSREPQGLIARVDGTLDAGSPGGQSFLPVVDTAGKVTVLHVPRTGHGRPFHLRRIEPWQAPAGDLGQYSGDYRSRELDITYSINIEDDELVARHLWSNQPLTFTPVLPDRFESVGTMVVTLVFQRETTGQIDHLLLHGRSDRNVRFDRVGAARAPVPGASTKAR
ncbi:MAG TPA: serine hydrolase domain-containing protein [Beutenbergiaceae bacterium]|nr:serine hydrolase domain-containing protein [Beutenbergiaceae bacterium]